MTVKRRCDPLPPRKMCKKRCKIKTYLIYDTYEISMSVVAMLIARPTIVMRLGANQSGTFETSQHHQGCRNGSIRLTLVQEYLWSYSFFSCAACSSFCL